MKQLHLEAAPQSFQLTVQSLRAPRVGLGCFGGVGASCSLVKPQFFPLMSEVQLVLRVNSQETLPSHSSCGAAKPGSLQPPPPPPAPPKKEQETSKKAGRTVRKFISRTSSLYPCLCNSPIGSSRPPRGRPTHVGADAPK